MEANEICFDWSKQNGHPNWSTSDEKSLDAGLKTPICQAIIKITKNQLNRR